ncbi:MAG: DUF1080 domain-containing protein [Phycisphaeraceae bacterium]
MKITTTLAVLTLLAAAAVTYTSANACDKCKKHNPTTAEDHGHEHLDEDEGFVTILGEGHTDGWTIDEDWMKIEDGVIVAGTMDKPIPKTMYAAHDKEYYNFELRAQAKAVGPEKTNGGFQIRSKYNAENGQMSGYQADMGFKYWGLVYDQSRRNRLLTKHEQGIDLKEDINWGEWNDYRVICKDNTIKVYINGKLFSQYTEKDEEIAKVKGVIGLQLHAGPASVRYYRNIRIKELD